MRCSKRVFEGKLYHSGELSFEASAVSPEPQARGWDKETLFTSHLVVAGAQTLWVVFFGHEFEISVAEGRAADLLLAEATRAIRNGKAALGRSVDEVGGCSEVAGKFRVFLDGCESGRRANISVLADQPIDRCIFAESFYSGSENNEFGAVGKRHASAIDCFIA